MRVNVDLYQKASKEKKPFSSILSGCRVIDKTKNKKVPCRVFYTNDLQRNTEQMAWRLEDGNKLEEYRIEISSQNDVKEKILPAIGAGEPLMTDEAPLKTGFSPKISIVDWDGDGKKDLIVGSSSEEGYVYFYKNTGEGNDPVFQDGIRLRADGKVITASSGNRKIGKCQPWAGDWDNDGLLDLLVLKAAKDMDSKITFYKNIGSKQNPVLKDMGHLLNQEGKPLILSSGKSSFYNSFYPVDWNKNGKKDILAVISDEDFFGKKRLVLFENVGTGDKPRFSQKPVPIKTKNGGDISFPGIIGAFLPVDWLREGFTDILLSTYIHYGKIFLYENVNKNMNKEPVLTDSSTRIEGYDKPPSSDFLTDYPVPILRLQNGEELKLPEVISSIQMVQWAPSSNRELIVATHADCIYRFKNLSSQGAKPVLDKPEPLRVRNTPIAVGTFAVPAAADWNKDGKPELIIGNESGELLYFENKQTMENPLFIHKGKVRSNGEVIKLPGANRKPFENNWGYASPVAVDLDMDGLIDLVVSESRGYFTYYKNTGSPKEPVFASGKRIYADGEIFQGAWRVRPAFFRDEEEKCTRMIAIEPDGIFYMYKNTRADILDFTKIDPLKMENGKFMYTPHKGRARISAVDWNGNGVLDLVIAEHSHQLIKKGNSYAIKAIGGGGYGAGLLLYKNKGTNTEPLFKIPEDIKTGSEILRRGMGHALNPAFINCFGNKNNDMLLGTEDGRIYLYRREFFSDKEPTNE